MFKNGKGVKQNMTKKKGARRYLIKGKEKSWVLRDKFGKFKKWISRKRAAKLDRRRKVSPPVKSGYGHKGDTREGKK